MPRPLSGGGPPQDRRRGEHEVAHILIPARLPDSLHPYVHRPRGARRVKIEREFSAPPPRPPLSGRPIMLGFDNKIVSPPESARASTILRLYSTSWTNRCATIASIGRHVSSQPRTRVHRGAAWKKTIRSRLFPAMPLNLKARPIRTGDTRKPAKAPISTPRTGRLPPQQRVRLSQSGQV